MKSSTAGPEPLAGDELTQSVRRGSLAVVACQGAAQIASLVILASLYRLLGPEPFGLVGLVLPIVMFGRIFTTGGLYVAGVQHPELQHEQASALFWLNQLIGLSSSLLVAASLPVLAWLHGSTDLVPIGLAMAGTLWATTLGVQHQVLLERQMRLGAVAVVRLGALIIAGLVAVSLAWSGYQAWALVAQEYLIWTLGALGLWWIYPWRPGRPRRGADMLHLVRVGGQYSTSGVLFWVASNVDKLLVGWLFGERALGFYYQAFNLAMRPVNALSSPLTGVMLPALSRARADREMYLRMLSVFWRLIALVSFPLGLGLVLTAPEAMVVLGSEKWLDAGPLLRVFSALILVHLFINVIGSVLTSSGRAGLLVWQAAALAASVLVALGVAMAWPDRTPYTFAVAYVAAYLGISIPYIGSCLRAVDMAPRSFWDSIRAPAVAAAVMGAVVLAVRLFWPHFGDLRPVVRLTMLVAAGASTYLGLVRDELRWVLGHVLQRGQMT